MKKILFPLVLAAAFFSTSLFAAETPEINAKAVVAFNSQFANASDVDWSIGENYYKADFRYNDNYVAAYYNTEGEFMATVRNISSVNLPLILQTNLKNSYSNYWISGLYEVAKTETVSYYITLENADQKIVLKSNGTIWSVYKKSNKA